MKENQEYVHESTEKLTETVKSTLEVFEANRGLLESIEEDIQAGNESEENSKTELFNVIRDGNEKYTDKVLELLSSIDGIAEEITKLDVHEDIHVLQQKLTAAETEIGKINEFASKNDADMHERLDQIEENIGLVTTGLTSLTDETQKINLAFETAIARMNNINLKLDVIVNSEDESFDNDEYENDTHK